MQVTLTPSTAAEARLLSAFINDMADLMETGMPAVVSAPLPAPDVAEAAPAKKRKRSATTAETQVESTSAETAAPADVGNEVAPAATVPAESSADTAGSTEASPDSQNASAAGEQACSLDELRILFGTLTQAGKRTEAVAVVRKYGANGLAEIPADKLGLVFNDLKGL